MQQTYTNETMFNPSLTTIHPLHSSIYVHLSPSIMMRKIFFLFLTFLLLTVATVSAQIQFSIKPGASIIGKEDVLQVSYEISGVANANFDPPLFPKWKLLSGPNFSSEQTMVNGKTEKKVSFVFLLQPIVAGTIDLPEATILIDGKKFVAKSVGITVKNTAHVAGASTPSNSVQLPGNILQEDIMSESEMDKTSILKPGENIAAKIKNNLFVKVIPNKQICFVGEPISVNYKLYTRLHSQSKVTKQPSFTGCTVYEMTEGDGSPQIEKINGKEYRVYTIRKLQLIPLQTGELKLDITSVDNEVTFFNSERDAYTGNGFVQNITVSNEPMSIHVNALPVNVKTKDSNIAIGNFSINATVYKLKDTAGDNNSLQITIQGTGNFQSIECPVIQWPSAIDHFETSSKDDVNKLIFPAEGSRTFTIPFTVKQKGTIIIPKIAFNYFDADKHEYKTVYADSIVINADEALKNNIDFSKVTEDISNRKYIWIVAGIALLAGFGIWLQSGKEKKKADEKIIIPKIKNDIPVIEKIAINYHEQLNELLLIEDDKSFYTKAKELIAAYTKDHPHKKALGDTLIQQCNEALYSPVSSINKETVFIKLESLIS